MACIEVKITNITKHISVDIKDIRTPIKVMVSPICGIDLSWYRTYDADGMLLFDSERKMLLTKI